MKQITLIIITLSLIAPLTSYAAEPSTEKRDTTIHVESIQVTAVKQGLTLLNQPIASTLLGRETIERKRIVDLHRATELIPNVIIPEYGSRITSSIYVRGLGARIDQPVIGLNIDNVPIMNKDAYDFDIDDIARIEMLRGPQSTLYGRNTMGGVMNIYTLSPLSFEGVRLGAEYSSGNRYKFRASSYFKVRDNLGAAVAAHYTSSDGLFTNQYTGKKCDWEESFGGRVKLQWQAKKSLRIDNTLSFGKLRQGGYPYHRLSSTEISYNDSCAYRRINISDGLTVRYDADKFTVMSITSYQYLDDEMLLDQDFTPQSYFTLSQAKHEHTFTEDLVIKSRNNGSYGWLFGAFGFYKHLRLASPVTFKQYGIDNLILKYPNQMSPNYRYRWNDEEFVLGSDFLQPTFGAALYHQSTFTKGRWLLTADLRVDFEHAALRYHNQAKTGYSTYRVTTDGEELIRQTPIDIDNRKTISQSFTEVLPKFSALYRIGANRRSSAYISVAKGYKAGGFNMQMFSDVLQQKIMEEYFDVGTQYEVKDVVSYKPEYSWNYEAGMHIETASGVLRADVTAFYIACRDQQLTIFPEGLTTGRMMTNAGRTRSVGGELSLAVDPTENIALRCAYGYTDARFTHYNDSRTDFKNKTLPYAPQNTLSAGADYTIRIGASWLEQIVLTLDYQGIGKIYWNEENTLSQPFYSLLGCGIRFEHKNYAVGLWGRNLTATSYDTFYFKSIGNEFMQSGRPRTFGVSIDINL